MGIRTHPLNLSESDYDEDWFGLRKIDVRKALSVKLEGRLYNTRGRCAQKRSRLTLSSAKPIEGRSSVCDDTRGSQECQYCEQGKKVKYSEYAGRIIQ